MSDLDFALRFIRDHPVTVSRSYPDIGGENLPVHVVFAAVHGDQLGWLQPDSDEALKSFVIPVRSVAAVSDSEVHVELDQEFPHVVAVFRKLTSTDDRADRTVALDVVDDVLDGAVDDLEQQLAAWKPPALPKKRSFSYVTWQVFRRGAGLQLAGVLGRDHGNLIAVPFLDFEDDAEDWEERFGDNAPPLDELQEFAGRTTLISGVEEIEGYDYHDALNRAAHQIAGRIYLDAGEVVFR